MLTPEQIARLEDIKDRADYAPKNRIVAHQEITDLLEMVTQLQGENEELRQSFIGVCENCSFVTGSAECLICVVTKAREGGEV
jgi:hypothetical protein